MLDTQQVLDGPGAAEEERSRAAIHLCQKEPLDDLSTSNWEGHHHQLRPNVPKKTLIISHYKQIVWA